MRKHAGNKHEIALRRAAHAGLPAAAAAVPAAEIAQSTGKVFEGENYTVIRETLPKGKEIPRHNHPGHTLLVTQTKGSSVFLFDGGKRQELRPGSVLKADGSEYVAIKITDDSELVIVLMKDAENGRNGK